MGLGLGKIIGELIRSRAPESKPVMGEAERQTCTNRGYTEDKLEYCLEQVRRCVDQKDSSELVLYNCTGDSHTLDTYEGCLDMVPNFIALFGACPTRKKVCEPFKEAKKGKDAAYCDEQAKQCFEQMYYAPLQLFNCSGGSHELDTYEDCLGIIPNFIALFGSCPIEWEETVPVPEPLVEPSAAEKAPAKPAEAAPEAKGPISAGEVAKTGPKSTVRPGEFYFLDKVWMRRLDPSGDVVAFIGGGRTAKITVAGPSAFKVLIRVDSHPKDRAIPLVRLSVTMDDGKERVFRIKGVANKRGERYEGEFDFMPSEPVELPFSVPKGTHTLTFSLLEPQGLRGATLQFKDMQEVVPTDAPPLERIFILRSTTERVEEAGAAAAAEQKPTVKFDPSIKTLTLENYRREWRDPMVIRVTDRYKDDELRKAVNDMPKPKRQLDDGTYAFGRVAVIDWGDPSGRELAYKLGFALEDPDDEITVQTRGGLDGSGCFIDENWRGAYSSFRMGNKRGWRGGMPSSLGFTYVNAGNLREHLVPHPDETVLLITGENRLYERLIREREALGGNRRYLWTDVFDLENSKELRDALSKLGIKPEEGAYRLVFEEGKPVRAESYKPVGYVTAASREDVERYIRGGRGKVIAVVGTDEGQEGKWTRSLLQNIMKEKAAGKDFQGMDIVYVNACVLKGGEGKRIGEGSLEDYVGKSHDLPQAYVVENGKVVVTPKVTGTKPKPVANEVARAVADTLAPRDSRPSPYRAMLGGITTKVTGENTAYSTFIGTSASPLVAIFGDRTRHAQVGDWIYHAAYAFFRGDEDAQLFYFDTSQGDLGFIGGKKPLLLDNDGKRIKEDHGVYKCQLAEDSDSWRCYPYKIPGDVAGEAGPMGFWNLELNAENVADSIGKVKKEIDSGEYPVMVVVGNIKRKEGEEHCKACVEFMDAATQAQESGRWMYHRLIFINSNDGEHAHNMMRKLGVLGKGNKYGKMPKVFVFYDGKEDPDVPVENMEAYYDSLWKHLKGMAQK